MPKAAAAIINNFRTNWRILSRASVWITAIIATFLATPPTNDLFGHGKTLASFAAFVVAVLAGLVVVAGRTWRDPQSARSWAVCSVLCLALSVTGFWSYNDLIGKWTEIYDDHRLVSGSVLTSMAQDAIKHDPSLTCEQLIVDADGRWDLVWVRDGVLRNAMNLLAAYMIAVVTLTICVLSLLSSLEYTPGGTSTASKVRRKVKAARDSYSTGIEACELTCVIGGTNYRPLVIRTAEVGP